jgi:hypothetical protein
MEFPRVDSKIERPRYVKVETEIPFQNRDDQKIQDMIGFEEASRKVDNVNSNIRDGVLDRQIAESLRALIVLSRTISEKRDFWIGTKPRCVGSGPDK